MVLLHLAAMFGPALVLRRRSRAGRRAPCRSCARCCWRSGAAFAAWAAAPLNLLGLAVAHGAAWGVAWGGQLWAPARRGQTRRIAAARRRRLCGVTLAFGLVVEHFGVRGVAAMHVALGLGAIAAWLVRGAPVVWLRSGAARKNAATVSPQSDHGAGR